MRRMITEKDVEKLDSIKPSEIEKLGAMQDPKTATAGRVLTAVSGGKAEYKAMPSAGTKIQKSLYFPFSQTGLQTDENGNKYIAKEVDYSGTLISVWMRDDLKANGNVIQRGDYITSPWINSTGAGRDQARIYFPTATIEKYSLSETTEFTGSFAYAIMTK